MPADRFAWPTRRPAPVNLADRARAANPRDVSRGTTGAIALHPWPTMPPVATPLDLQATRPARLRTYPGKYSWSQMVGAAPSADFDWATFLDLIAQSLIQHIDRGVSMTVQPFSVGAVATLVRPEEERRYFFIQNTHAANNLFLGIGFAPTAIYCIQIPALGFFEPLWVPKNEIWIAGSAAATTGAIGYAL